MKIEKFSDGVAILGDADSKEVIDEVSSIVENKAHLIVTDPPYGNIVDEQWDKWSGTQKSFVDWMISWTNSYSRLLVPGGAMYVWGGYGKPKFRPFFEYSSRVEQETCLSISNALIWSKKRAYGVQKNYLSTREDILYMVNGDPKKPATFHIPLLETKRGYAGYNKKYPAKSEFYRRTNVWNDITEIFRGKVHTTQKPLRVYEVPIEVNTNEGDWVIDQFAGSMTAAFAARKLNRKWVCIESNEKIFEGAIDSLKSTKRSR